jgi:small subunit ribosomal protein S16
MLRIRLQRKGRTKIATYRVVVVESARAARKHALEELGSYDPHTKKPQLDVERVKYWISVGAQPTGTVHNMLVSAKVISGKKVNVLPKKTVPKKEEEPAVEAAPAAAPAAEAPAPAAETSVEAEPTDVAETPAA